jgi:colicin import membrane protein
MPGFFREHLRPLAGSAGLHLLIVAALAVAAMRWTSPQPPVQLAIEGVVVDGHSLPDSQRAGRPKQRPSPAPEPAAAAPAPAPQPEPVPLPDERRKASEQAEQEAALRVKAAEEAKEAKEAKQELARRQAEAKKAAEAQQKRQAERDAQSKAKADEAERREAAEADAKRKAQAAAAAAQDAKVKADREAELSRRVAAEAAEEEGAAAARSGIMDEYRSLLSQAIERSWIRPPSAKAGLECTLFVSQAPGGTVVDVKLGACNGDQSVRESIVNAVYRALPLPAPRDPRAFERRLEIVFRPTE